MESGLFESFKNWDFHDITMNPWDLQRTGSKKKKKKVVVHGSCLGKNDMLMAEIRGGWPDCLEMTRGQQETQAISCNSRGAREWHP